ncbi:MAG: hypothetical protein Q9195_002699 [Heterodermia aff. obscurata]
MLTESFIVSTLNPSKQAQTSHSKDLGIHLHEYQPNPSLKSSLKKSSTQPNCLAASASHIFAAQSEKAVVHVYNRELGNQEAIVPFPERIRSLAFAGDTEQDVGVLVLGTEAGGLVLWELATGRTVTTPPTHLEAITHLADSPDANFVLSGSIDSAILLWSVPSLLAFEYESSYSNTRPHFSPLITLSSHRAAITALLFGHSHGKTNIALSASADNTLLVWDPLRGQILHTFLLSSPSLCLALDPADRACYAGYEDGSIQLIDFYKSSGPLQMLRNPALQSTPTQPPYEERWRLPAFSEGQEALCLQTSYDGTSILSGHKNGKVHTWDVGRGRYGNLLAEHDHSVTNLLVLPPTGFPNPKIRHLRLKQVIKPKYESSFATDASGSSGGVPIDYTLTAQFTSNMSLSARHETAERDFEDALCHPSFPTEWLEEGIDAFAAGSSWNQKQGQDYLNDDVDEPNSETGPAMKKLQADNDLLKAQLAEAMARHRATIHENMLLEKQQWKQKEEERIKGERKKRRRLRRVAAAENARTKVMGEVIEGESDEEMNEGGEEEEEEELSSSTDEITDSD